jgi:hypothetical protein
MQMLPSAATAAKENNQRFMEFADLVISCFDVSAVNDLNEKNALWSAFDAVLRGTFQSSG